MAIVSAEKFVQAARDNGYAVGGFNTNNLEWTQAILRAAEAKKAPVLIQTSMGAAKYMGGYKLCKVLIETLVESMGITVPVAIHLDHGHYEDALECIEVGYTSIMFDGSHLPVEENLEKAKEVVAKAHAKGISVEAEVGTIGGEEDGIIGRGELAPIDDAKAMVETPSKREKYEITLAGNKANLTQLGRESGMKKLMMINLLKRLESSVAAFRYTLIDVVKSYVDETLKAISTYEQTGLDALSGVPVLNEDELLKTGPEE